MLLIIYSFIFIITYSTDLRCDREKRLMMLSNLRLCAPKENKSHKGNKQD
jgi:hypothetical protein